MSEHPESMSIENKQNIDVFGGRPSFRIKPQEAGIFGGGGNPKFESVYKGLEDKNDKKRQEAEDQRRKLGEQAASIKDSKGKNIVDYAQDSLSSAFANEGGEVFDNLRARATRFEIATRELYPDYKKAGNMHHDKGQEKDGVAARIFIEEAKFLRDEQNKQAKNQAPQRAVAWFPRTDKNYLVPNEPSDKFSFDDPFDFSFDDDTVEPGFLTQVSTVDSLADTQRIQTVTTDTLPSQPTRSEYAVIYSMMDSLAPEALAQVQASLVKSLMDDVNSVRPDRAEIEQLIKALGEKAKQGRGGASVAGGAQQALEEANRQRQEQLRIQQQMYEAQQKQLLEGKAGFFHALYDQGKLETSPEVQVWFASLTEAEKDQIRTLYKLAVVQEQKKLGLKGLETYSEAFHLQREELVSLWKFDGYRMAMATMMHDMFTLGDLNPPTDGRQQAEAVRGLVLTGNGKKILAEQDEDKAPAFSRYRNGLVEKLKTYYTANPQKIPFGFLRENGPRDQESLNRAAKAAAEASFASAWLLMSTSMVPESTDNTRGVFNLDKSVIVGGFRTFFHAHDQAVAKWTKGDDQMGEEEELFGILGTYFRERNMHNPQFKEAFRRYDPGKRFFLRVNMGSLFDHSRFTDNETLAQKLVNTNKTEQSQVVPGLWDYSNPGEIDFMQLQSGDIASGYTEVMDTVNKVHGFVTANEIKNPIGQYKEFLAGIVKLQGLAAKGDGVLKQIYGDFKDPKRTEKLEDLIVGGIGATAGGFSEFTNRLLLQPGKFPRDLGMRYDKIVTTLLQDDRIYKILGVEPGSGLASRLRKRLLGRLSAYDYDSWVDQAKGRADDAHDNGIRGMARKEIVVEKNNWK